MSTLKNRVQLIGRLGQNPEIKTLEGGKKLAKLSLATNESYKDQKGEKVEKTTWHNVIAWGNTAAVIEKYVTKGQEIAIEGKLQNNNYEDKNGTTHYITEIVANEIQLFGKGQA
jgi:single-strand DNA-binding protein